MMAQGVLPYKYSEETMLSGLTALGGLPVYLDLAQVLGLTRSIRRNMGGGRERRRLLGRRRRGGWLQQ